MSFLKHLLPGWKRTVERKQKANAAILAALDKELSDTEKETIQSKVMLSLDSATGEWLNQYGKLFGLLRKDGEIDNAYRSRILEYIQLQRGTIPAIKDAIRAFLNDYESHIEIYEPHTNIFTLNKSKLNGPDHFLGKYYTVAVIDIRISRPFPLAIMETINEFKPAGVTVRLTYQPNGHNPNAPIIEVGPTAVTPKTEVHRMSGMMDRIRGHLNLTVRSRDEDDESGIFILNKSKLNSADRLTGSFAVANPSFNLASHSTDDVLFSTDTTIEKVLENTERLSADFYTKTGDLTDRYAAASIDSSTDSHLYFTLDVATYFSLRYEEYLREIQPDGIYTRNTYASLMKSAAVLYHMKAQVPPTKPSTYYVQMLNLVTGRWDSLGSGQVKYEIEGGKLRVGNISSYISDTGLVFTRIKVNANTGVPDYNLDIHFFELSFHKEISIQPTAYLGVSEVTSEGNNAGMVDGGKFNVATNSELDGGDFDTDPTDVYDGGTF
jgi:hypothetical protein